MKMFGKSNRSRGFTFLEVSLWVLVIGVTAGLTLPAVTRARDRIDAPLALDQDRDLQKFAAIYFAEHGAAPDLPTLEQLYTSGGKGNSIVGKYAIVPVRRLNGSPRPDAQGNVPASYVICSTMPLHDAAYVYSYDDFAPQVADKGTDPVGSGLCAPSAPAVAVNGNRNGAEQATAARNFDNFNGGASRTIVDLPRVGTNSSAGGETWLPGNETTTRLDNGWDAYTKCMNKVAGDLNNGSTHDVTPRDICGAPPGMGQAPAADGNK